MILAPTGSVLWINFEYLNLQSHSKTIFVYFCKRICKYPNLVTICLSQADLYLGNKAQIHLPPLYLGSFCATLKFVNGIGCLLASWHQCLLLPTCKHYGCELYVDSISEPPPLLLLPMEAIYTVPSCVMFQPNPKNSRPK